MSTPFLRAFLLAISIVFSAFKTPWLESLLTQLPTPTQLQILFIGFQFSNESILNCLLLSTVHSTTLAFNTCIYILHPYTPSRQLRSASLNLLSQPCINIALASRGFQNAGASFWNSLFQHLRSTDSYAVFNSYLKTYRFSGAIFSGPKEFLSTCF